MGLAREAGPHRARLPDDGVCPRAEAQKATPERALPGALADVWVQRRALTLRAVPTAATVRGPVVPQAEGPARAASGDRVRPRFPLHRPWHPRRHRRQARESPLAAEVLELHRRLSRGRARDSLRPTDAPSALREERPCHPGRDDRGAGRQDRSHEMAVQGRPHRVGPVARRPRSLFRLLGSQGLCARRAQAAQSNALECRDGRQGHRCARIRERDRLRRHVRRSCVRARRAHRPAALARRVLYALRAPGVLLRYAGRCLRARLPRQHGRNGLRLRCDHGKPALGAAGGDVRLLRARGLAEHGVRRDVGRVLLGARCAHRRLPLAVHRSRRGDGGALGAGRSRLLLDVRQVRPAPPEAREERPPGDVRAQRPHRRSCLAVPRRPLLAGRSRRPANLHIREAAHLRAHPAGAPQADPALAGPRALRPIPKSKKASAMPVKGQTRYELWKTRLRKSSTNIEIEKPAAPGQRVPARF